MLIDTHTHLNFNAFKDDARQIIKKCLSQNIWIINVGSQYNTSKRAVDIAEKYNEGVYAAIGLHPIHTIPSPLDKYELTTDTKSGLEKFDARKYRELAKNKKVVAIGEIGLDYTYAKTEQEKSLQKEAFIAQIKLAQELKLPIIIHCRDAWQDTLGILQKFYKVKQKKSGVAHFFSGTLENAHTLFNLGFLVSFTGVITFADSYLKLIKKIPLEKIIIETDSPYVAPIPYRGKRNTPLYVKYIAQKLAEVKAVSLREIAEITTKNAKELFNISN